MYGPTDDDDLDDLDLPDDDTPPPGPSTGKASPLQQGTVVPAGWKPTMAKPIPNIRCTGTVRNGDRKGERCGKWAIQGGTVCRSHGGTIPNVQEYAKKMVEAARLRLIDDADLAIDTLFELIQPGTADQVRLGASKEILDRAGVKGPIDFHVEVEHKVSPVENIKNRLANIAKRQNNPVDLGEVTGITVEDEEPSEDESE